MVYNRLVENMKNLFSYKNLLSPSVISLIIVNLIPIIGVLYFDWSLIQILILYWAESGVIGFYNIFKIIFIGKFSSIVFVPFFIIHYGLFMLGHLIFIFGLFSPELIGKSLSSPSSKEFIILLFSQVALPILILLISHGISFFSNFIKNREYSRGNSTKAGMQMMVPYGRIFVMHITLILGALPILLLGKPIFGLLILVILKTLVDLRAHLKEHGLSDSQYPPILVKN